MGRAAACVCASVVALGIAACAGSDDGPPPPTPSGQEVRTAAGTATPYGTGAKQVWVHRPVTGEVRSVVVYLHGFGATLPFEWHQAWIDHLLARGSAVIFPRYQEGSSDDSFVATPFDLAHGLRTGFRALDADDLPVVAAGFSLGALLTFFYATRADAWGVPAPEAVYSIFPVDPLSVDPGLQVELAEGTEVLILVGDQDDVVGRAGADELWAQLTDVPGALKEYRVIRTTRHLLADHEAPTYVQSPAVREAFWTPLDELVERARSTGPG